MISSEIQEIEEKLEKGDIPVIFIVGHGRSGTTNMHSSLAKSERVVHSQMSNVIGQSYFIRYTTVFGKHIMTSFLDFLGVTDQKNHGVAFDEPAEEPQFLLTGGVGVACYAMNIGLGADAEVADYCFNSFDDMSTNYIRAAMARSILWEGRDIKDPIYIGCIVDTYPIELVFKAFGNVKLIYSIREPKAVFKSFANMYQQIYQVESDDPRFVRNTEYLYEYYSKKRFEQMLHDTEATKFHDRIWYIDFEDWKKDSKSEFQEMCKWLGIEGVSLPAKKAEGHKNNSDCFNIVSKEKIDTELGPTFSKIVENVNIWKGKFRN